MSISLLMKANAESRKAHNVARMNSMLHLARDMMRKRTSMESIVEKNFADLERWNDDGRRNTSTGSCLE